MIFLVTTQHSKCELVKTFGLFCDGEQHSRGLQSLALDADFLLFNELDFGRDDGRGFVERLKTG